jgi:hypothetical protein
MKSALALLALVAAIAAAPAGASPDRGYRWITDAPQPTSLITDTLAPGGGTVNAPQPQGYRFITDTLAPGGGAAVQPVAVSVGRGFAWSDAGIGSLVTAGALLIVLGGSMLVRHRMRPAI